MNNINKIVKVKNKRTEKILLFYISHEIFECYYGHIIDVNKLKHLNLNGLLFSKSIYDVKYELIEEKELEKDEYEKTSLYDTLLKYFPEYTL